MADFISDLGLEFFWIFVGAGDGAIDRVDHPQVAAREPVGRPVTNFLSHLVDFHRVPEFWDISDELTKVRQTAWYPQRSCLPISFYDFLTRNPIQHPINYGIITTKQPHNVRMCMKCAGIC